MSTDATRSPLKGTEPMEEEQRHLAAIVFTDVAGYSARMQRDERGTLTAVRADFERMKKVCRKYRGEVLNTMGDGMLLCFSSAVKGVAFSLQIQSEFGKRAGAGAPDGPLEHRIGIHVGDIFRHEGQVAGDGVNIAARLQTKAPPGGICVSDIVYNMVNGKMPLQAEPLGVQEFKNISKLSVYCLSVSAASAARARAIARRYPAKIMAAVAVAGALAIGFIIWKRVPHSAPEKSIAVLPFANLSSSADNAFFADGIHEDLITNLARISDLKVISRTSVMAYRDPGKRNLRKIASELGVANVLEGSVRREGNQVRITAQLIDARTDQHLWAETYDRKLDNVFEVQAAIAEEIAKTLAAGFKANERAAIARSPTRDPEAYDLFLQARAALETASSSGKVADYNRAASFYDQAVKKDPAFAIAWGELSTLHGVMYWWGSLDPSADRMAKARAALDAVMKLAPDAPETHVAIGNFAYRCENDWAKAAREYEIARPALLNDADLLVAIGAAQRRLGKWTEAIAALDTAVKLNPRDFSSIDTYLNTALWMRRYQLVRSFNLNGPEPGIVRTLGYNRNQWLAESEVSGLQDRSPSGTEAPLENYRYQIDIGYIPGAEEALRKITADSILDAGGVANEPVALHRALLAFAQDNVGAARQAAGEALAYYRSHAWTPRQEAVALAGRARAEALAGSTAEAIRDARDALARTKARDQFDAVLVQMSLGETLIIAGERPQALAVLRELMGGPCPKPASFFPGDPVWGKLADLAEFKEILKTAKAL